MMQQTVLLTGANGVFGRLYLRYLLGKGYQVVALTRNESRLRDLCNEYNYDQDNIVGIGADLLDPDTPSRVVKELNQKKISIEFLINAARSIEFLNADLEGVVSREDFIGEYYLDVYIPYKLSMKLAYSPDSTLRQIINIGSQYGTVASLLPLYENPKKESLLNYSVAKAALVQLTKELGTRFAERNIQVNCISYGGLEGRVDDAFRSRYARHCPIGRMLNEDEVITPLHMLISNPCMALTGHVIHADGGWSLW